MYRKHSKKKPLNSLLKNLLDIGLLEIQTEKIVEFYSYIICKLCHYIIIIVRVAFQNT